MQNLLILQSLWTFEDLNTPPCAPTLEARLDLIKSSGFAGAGTLWLDIDTARETSARAAERGLILEGLALPHSVDALKPALEWGTAFGLHHLNIQPNLRTGDLDTAIALLEGWQRLAEEVDFPVHVETHRGRLTNDLFFTLKLIEACPWVKLTADLSHYVAGGEIVLPVDALHDGAISQILWQAAAYHGRIATSEQVQAEIGFPQHKPWVDQFSAWWFRGFRAFRKKAGPDAELTFLCELGARPYAVTDAQNRDLSDRWADSLALKALAERLWQMTDDTP